MYTRLRPIANKIGREGKWEDECSNTCTFQDITFNSSVYESRLQFHPKNVLNAASCNSPKMPRILFRIINGQCRKFIWGCLKTIKGIRGEAWGIVEFSSFISLSTSTQQVSMAVVDGIQGNRISACIPAMQL